MRRRGRVQHRLQGYARRPDRADRDQVPEAAGRAGIGHRGIVRQTVSRREPHQYKLSQGQSSRRPQHRERHDDRSVDERARACTPCSSGSRPLARRRIRRPSRPRAARPTASTKSLRVLDTAVDAVAYAHAQGVVHRDLNPGNFFLARTSSGVRLKVLDFGVAKVMADSVLAMPSARTVGNLRMFAPGMRARNNSTISTGAVGPWTDVYALALVTLGAPRQDRGRR